MSNALSDHLLQSQTEIPTDFELKSAMVKEVKRIQVEHPKSLEEDFERRRGRR